MFKKLWRCCSLRSAATCFFVSSDLDFCVDMDYPRIFSSIHAICYKKMVLYFLISRFKEEQLQKRVEKCRYDSFTSWVFVQFSSYKNMIFQFSYFESDGGECVLSSFVFILNC